MRRGGPAVDQNVLAGDEAGPGAGQKSAQRAEFGRIAETPGRNAGQRLGARVLERRSALGGDSRQRGVLTLGLEGSGLDRVDRDILGRMSPRRCRQERGQARPGAGRDVEPGDRRAHRAGCDVDDAPESALRHAGQERLDEGDRRQHVRLDAGQDVLAGDRAERLERRAAIVVDEDVGVGAGGEQRRARRRIVEVARDLVNHRAGPIANCLRRRTEAVCTAGVEKDLAAGFGERLGAGAPQTFAGSADDRFSAGNAKIHVRLDCSTPL
jgi:hypothetical protein